MVNCIRSMHNTAPYELGSEEGIKISMAKRAIIGLIVAAALAVGGYYLEMATNLWNYPPNVHFGMSIAGSVLIGAMLLVGTTGWVISARRMEDQPT